MPRPCKHKIVSYKAKYTCFKPAGVPRNILSKIDILAEELEALRLVYGENLLQAEAAEKMGISASTLNRLLKSAIKKITDALVNGKWIRIYNDSLPDCDMNYED